MSNETVVVPVTLPKPPEGWEWYLDFTVGGTLEANLKCRRVAPPERTVMVELRESTARRFNDKELRPGAWDEIVEAVRVALARRACGVPVYSNSQIGSYSCPLREGHDEGAHAP